jgi:hypothetical protein
VVEEATKRLQEQVEKGTTSVQSSGLGSVPSSKKPTPSPTKPPVPAPEKRPSSPSKITSPPKSPPKELTTPAKELSPPKSPKSSSSVRQDPPSPRPPSKLPRPTSKQPDQIKEEDEDEDEEPLEIRPKLITRTSLVKAITPISDVDSPAPTSGNTSDKSVQEGNKGKQIASAVTQKIHLSPDQAVEKPKLERKVSKTSTRKSLRESVKKIEIPEDIPPNGLQKEDARDFRRQSSPPPPCPFSLSQF